MGRLIKKALGGNIQLSDVEFIKSDDMIEMKLINENKMLHDREDPWQYTSFYYAGEDEDRNTIGFISWDTFSKGEYTVINVDYLEIREEYRQTRVVRYLLDNFIDTIVNPIANHVGKDKVLLDADFVNGKLAEVLYRRLESETGLKWLKDVIIPSNDDDEIEDIQLIARTEFYEKLKSQYGTDIFVPLANSEITTVVCNFPFKNYLNAIEEIDMYDANVTYGMVTMDSGDIIYTYDYDDYRKVANQNNVEFDFFGGLLEFKDTLQKIKMLPSNFIQNLKIVFDDTPITYINSQTRPCQSIDEFKELLTDELQVASRLKKMKKEGYK